ncbi:Protein MTH_152, putative [Ricinus communis]|uniref:Protein MTH_152, putative n=1 Tax=Ricinus communis TaxID=3988 RepID=B9TKP7_RICCO|nr:Protein MTH_152, putative [Ricinus communis]
MQIDPADHSVATGYKLLTNLVVPRPIAWVSTLNENDSINLAPFSFFNAVGSDPLYIIVSVGEYERGQPKDTARNIRARGEFVVNLVTEELFEAMNLSAAEFPYGRSELEAAGLQTAESSKIKTPRVAQARASLECRLHEAHPVGNYTLFIGEVVMFHIADELLGERLHINGFAPIGRMGAPSVYCRTGDRFDVPRIKYSDYAQTRDTPPI